VLGVILGMSAVAAAFTIARHGEVRGPVWMWAHFDAGLARVLFDFFAGVAIYRLRMVLKLQAFPWRRSLG